MEVALLTDKSSVQITETVVNVEIVPVIVKADLGPSGVPGLQGPAGADGVGIPVGGDNGQILAKGSGADYDAEWIDPVNAATWGSITGTLSAQTDLQSALNGKQPLSTVLTNTTASFTTAQATKLSGIAAGAEVNVNADWNAISGDAQILNKPTLGTAAAQNVGYFATAAQGLLADSALQSGDNVSELTNDAGYLTASDVIGYVPYTGAIADVDLGGYSLSADLLNVSKSITASLASSFGALYWQYNNEFGPNNFYANSTDFNDEFGGSAGLSVSAEEGSRLFTSSGQSVNVNNTDVSLTASGYTFVFGDAGGFQFGNNALATDAYGTWIFDTFARFANAASFSLPPIAASAAPNTGIYFPNSTTIGFTTNGAPRAFINSNGLGIGRAATTHPFDVTSGTNLGFMRWQNGSAGGGGSPSLELGVGTSSGATAGAYMQLTGRLEAWSTLIATTNATGARVMRFGNSTNGVIDAVNGTFAIQRLNDAGNAITATPFQMSNVAPANSFIMLANGDLGLGTSTAALKLHVVKNDANKGLIRLQNTATNGYNSFEMYDSGGNFHGAIGTANASTSVFANTFYITGASGVPVVFGINSIERARLHTNGNFGIGTNNPLAKLVVNDTVSSGDLQVCLSVNNTAANGYSVFRIGTATAAAVGVGIHQFNASYSGSGTYTPSTTTMTAFEAGGLKLHADNAAGAIRFYTAGNTASNERMVIDSSGRIAIGSATANANAALDIVSTTRAFLPPRMTTTQKNAIATPTAGMVVYDSTLNKLCIYGAASWETITSV